jgi:type IV pilus assembly protein PilN
MWLGIEEFWLMIRINLLPHRQIKRAERQRQFTVMAGATGVLGAVIVFMGLTIVNGRIDAQVERNTRLEAAIVVLDKQIEEIKVLKSQIQSVLERKQVVENLQTNRSQAVVMLDELGRQLPEGVYLKSIKQEGILVTMEGVADNNARIATLVRNLSSSNWLESPGLIEIKSNVINSIRQNDFTMTVKIRVLKAEDDKSTKKSGVNNP